MALYPFIESDQVMPWLEIQHLSDVTFKSNSLPVAGSRAEQRFVVTRPWQGGDIQRDEVFNERDLPGW